MQPETRQQRTTTPNRSWTGFYEAHKARQPHAVLLQAAGRFSTPGSAIDLGYGSGNETIHLLEAGWSVLAIDRQPNAASLLEERVPPSRRASLEIRVASFEDAPLPAASADLIFAGFSLPFCAPSLFDALWSRITTALAPGGRFAGHLFGVEDDWSKNPHMTFHTRSHVERLLAGFDVETLHEVCGPGRSYEGPKRWHVFHVVAHKPIK